MMHISAKAGRGEAKQTLCPAQQWEKLLTIFMSISWQPLLPTHTAVTTLVSVGILLISLQHETWHKWVSAD